MPAFHHHTYLLSLKSNQLIVTLYIPSIYVPLCTQSADPTHFRGMAGMYVYCIAYTTAMNSTLYIT